MEIWELVARESVRDLVQRYNANGDSGRFGPLLDLFAEDASMELKGRIYRGHGEIRITGCPPSLSERKGNPRQTSPA